MTKLHPKLVAFDLDGTVWYSWLNSKKFHGRDNLEPFTTPDGHHQIRDKRNHAIHVTLSKDIGRIITDLVKKNIQIAIVSRNTDKDLCDRALFYSYANNPHTNKAESIIKFVDYDEVKDESKLRHFKRIQEWCGFSYADMLFFDDQPLNMEVETWEGVTFHLIHHTSGHHCITWADYTAGLEAWRKNHRIFVPHGLKDPTLIDHCPRKMLIGYAGTHHDTAKEYVQGHRRPWTVHPRPARWGHALYVSDNPQIALFFGQWKRDSESPSDLYVCEIFVRDKQVFIDQLAKLWFHPERQYLTHNLPSGTLTQAQEHDVAKQVADSQVHRDEFFKKKFKISKPYALFSRHHYMAEMGKPKYQVKINPKKRFNELVLYPQIQDHLLFGKAIPLEHARGMAKSGKLRHLHYERHVKNWKITVPHETRLDSNNHDKTNFFGPGGSTAHGVRSIVMLIEHCKY
ncbi:acid phosphatase-domain-containing protein [Favolaschia claudopus]|uniref:Acid phosphatase-domain-containing protein n=1 Tax=Favolaschia claudopus TaxID=2862362 RepID=A0AAW0A2H5_9AGAR